jgi:hypothetical protein
MRTGPDGDQVRFIKVDPAKAVIIGRLSAYAHVAERAFIQMVCAECDDPSTFSEDDIDWSRVIEEPCPDKGDPRYLLAFDIEPGSQRDTARIKRLEAHLDEAFNRLLLDTGLPNPRPIESDFTQLERLNDDTVGPSFKARIRAPDRRTLGKIINRLTSENRGEYEEDLVVEMGDYSIAALEHAKFMPLGEGGPSHPLGCTVARRGLGGRTQIFRKD